MKRLCWLVLLAMFCRAASAWGAEGSSPVVVADFEEAADARMVSTRKGVTISSDISSRGRNSLRIRAGDYININTGRLGRSRPGDLLKLDLFNAMAVPQAVRVEIFDSLSGKGYWYRHVRAHMVRPGWNTLRFQVARLYRGEMGAQRVGNSYLDPATIKRVDMEFPGAGESGLIYLDNVRFEPDAPLPAVDGLRAFDFGPENQAVRFGFTPCSQELYARALGYGWSKRGPARDYFHPNDLLGDFRDATGAMFSVDVPDGRYHVLVYFEEHGWWEDQFCFFSRRTITAQKKVVVDERLTKEQIAEQFYRFADTEPSPRSDLYDIYIRNGRFKPKEFEVDVTAGALDIRFDADAAMACRVAALVLWPVSSARMADEWRAELDRRMHEEFDAEYVYVETAPSGRSVQALPQDADGLVLFSTMFEPAGMQYVPSEKELLSDVHLFCVPGEDTGTSLGVIAASKGGPLQVTAQLDGLESEVFLVQNRIRRHHGGYTVVPDILRKVSEVSVEAGQTRQFWLEVSVPAGTRPGEYKGEAAVQFRGKVRKVPLSVEVLPVRLAEPRMAFGLFGLSPDPYAPAWALPMLVETLKRHGMSSVTGINLGLAGVKRGALAVDFTSADETMTLLKKAGFRLSVDTYAGGGLGGLTQAADTLKQPRLEVLKRAMELVRQHAEEAAWLPFSYSMVDEPQWADDAVEAAAESVAQSQALAPWLSINGYWSPNPRNKVHRRLMDLLNRTTMSHITPEAVRYLKSKGKQIGFYGGVSRNDFGLRQWAAAAEGFDVHYAWHLYVRYGDLYYDLDGREPDVCMVYYTPTELRLSLGLKAVRAGAFDFLYLQTLADAVEKAPNHPAADEARELLEAARKAGNLYREKSAPKIDDIDGFRRKVADAILKLTRGEEK